MACERITIMPEMWNCHLWRIKTISWSINMNFSVDVTQYRCETIMKMLHFFPSISSWAFFNSLFEYVMYSLTSHPLYKSYTTAKNVGLMEQRSEINRRCRWILCCKIHNASISGGNLCVLSTKTYCRSQTRFMSEIHWRCCLLYPTLPPTLSTL